MNLPTPVKRLTARAHLSTYTGYSQIICEYFKHLSAAGIYVTLRPIAIDEQWGKTSAIPTQMRAQIVNERQPEPWEFLLAPPDNSPTPGRKTVWMSMFESTQLSPQYVQLLNRAEAVIVPCEWNKEHFKANGVRVPVYVCALGFDPAVFTPLPVASHGPCIFGVAGRTKHCSARKNLQSSIDLFLKTFPTQEDVRLHVKIHPDDVIAEVKDHRIKVERRHFEPYELANWIRNLTCYMTLSRAEGYGLWPLQCMASGRPVIGCSYSGQADFMNAKNSLLVDFKEVDAQSGESNVRYEGQWAEPNLKSAAMHLGNIYRNRDMAIAAGQRASESVAHLTWANSAKRLLAVLNKVGVWK